jgi:hypothetical protein
MKLLNFNDMMHGEEGVEGVYGFPWTSWSSLFQTPIGVSTLLVWNEWCPSLKKTLWVIKKKKPISKLAYGTFPLLINICSNCPTALSVCKKCVNICEVDVLGLGFKVSSRIGGYISWLYIIFSFFCCYNDSTKAYKDVIFCNI